MKRICPVKLAIVLLAALSCGTALFAAQRSAAQRSVKGNTDVIEATATGTFDVKLTPAGTPDAPVSAMAISKTFHGDLDGTSAGQMLAVRTAVDGSAGYVAMERVTATLGGSHGSFALQHSGSMDRGAQSLSVTVVPDSATEGLAGLTGAMDIKIDGGEHRYIFRYKLPR